MADDQVKYSELLVKDEDVFANLIKELGDVKAKISELKSEASGLSSVLKNISSATREQQQATAANAKSVEVLAQKTKELATTKKNLEDATKRFGNLTDEEVGRLDRLATKLKFSSQWQEATAKLVDTTNMSYNEMKATLAVLTNALHTFGTEEKKNSDEAKALENAIERVRDAMKDLDDRTKAVAAAEKQMAEEAKKAAKEEEESYKASQKEAAQRVKTQEELHNARQKEIEDAFKARDAELAKLKLTEEEYNSLRQLKAALQGTSQEQIAAVQNIDIQNKSYNELYQTYNALKDVLNGMTTAERESSQAGKVMTTTAMTIRDKMNELQKATGTYTLQVGKYKAAFDGLGFSFMQIAREAPSALNLNQFFLAISNNLPMFFDQVDRFKTEQKEIKQTLADLAAQGKQTSDEYTKIAAQQTTVFKRLGAAIFSMQGAVLVFTMILRFLPKIVGWVKQLISGVSKWAQELVTVRRLMVQIDGAAEQALSKTRAEIELVLDDLNNATRGTVAFQNAVARLNELMGTSFDTVHAIPDEIKKATEAYIEQQRQLAINNKIVELYAANEMKKYAKQHISDGTFDSDTLAKLLGFDGDQAKEVAKAIEDYRTQIKTRQDAAEKLEAQWAEMRGNYGQGYANTTLAQLSQRGEYAKLAKDPGLFNQLNGRSKYDIYTLLGQYESETSMKPTLWQRMWGIDTPAEKVNEIMDNVTDDTQAILDMYNELYVAVPGSKKGDGGKKEDRFDFSPEEVNDQYWEAEKARIGLMEDGLKKELELQKLAHAEALEQNDIYYNDREEQLMDNLMGELMLLTKGNEKAASEMFDAIVKNDSESVSKMGVDAQQLAQKYWSDIEIGQQQHDAIMQGLEVQNERKIKELRMKNLADRKKEWKANADEVEKNAKDNAKRELKAEADNWQKRRAQLVAENADRRALIDAEFTAEIARLKLMLQLNRDVNGEKMSDEQRQKIEEWINLLEKLQKAGDFGGINPNQVFGKGGANLGNRKAHTWTNIVDVLTVDKYGNNRSWTKGLFGDMDTEEINRWKSGVQEAFNQAKAALQTWMDARKEAADQAKEQADDAVSAAENALNREIELRNQGYANNVALRERELADAKKAQQQAIEAQKKAEKEQLAIDTAMQASSIVTAIANIIKEWSKMGIAGQVASVGAILTMLGTFAWARTQAFAAVNSKQYRDGGVMLLEGGSHESGHDVNLGIGPDGSNLRAEGGEYFAVINKRNSRKYGSEIPAVVNALNSGMFEDRYIKTSDAVGLLPRIIRADDGSAVDLSAVESGVGELVKQGERTWSTEGEYRVMRYKNLTRRVRIG